MSIQEILVWSSTKDTNHLVLVMFFILDDPQTSLCIMEKNEMVCMVELNRACEHAWIIDKFHTENHPNF